MQVMRESLIYKVKRIVGRNEHLDLIMIELVQEKIVYQQGKEPL